MSDEVEEAYRRMTSGRTKHVLVAIGLAAFSAILAAVMFYELFSALNQFCGNLNNPPIKASQQYEAR